MLENAKKHRKSKMINKLENNKNEIKQNVENTSKMRAERLETHLKRRSLKTSVFKFRFYGCSNFVVRVLAEKTKQRLKTRFENDASPKRPHDRRKRK